MAKPAAAAPGLDLEALTSSLNKAAKAGGARSSAPKGANRPETARAAREGKGLADAALANAGRSVGERLNKIWTKDCSIEGADSMVVTLIFNLSIDGEVVGQPQILNPRSDPIWQAAAQRAVRAVFQAAPYKELPKASYAEWKSFKPTFDSQTACRGR